MTKTIDIPARPTTQELHASLSLSPDAELAILQRRTRLTQTVQSGGLLIIAGNCARPVYEQQPTLLQESDTLVALEAELDGTVLSHRGCVHKPRTDPKQYQGEEQRNPSDAYRSVIEEATRNANVSMEVRHPEHLRRYGTALLLAWTGGRDVGNARLMQALIAYDASLPLGIKNGVDGRIQPALDAVRMIRSARRGHENAGLVLPIYRGGDTARTPEQWAEQYKRMHDLTKGQFIIDVAHGTEMAHDPNGNFKKSVAGQILGMQAVITLTRQGYRPAGVMLEASDLPSRVDPHMPMEAAVAGIRALTTVRIDK